MNIYCNNQASFETISNVPLSVIETSRITYCEHIFSPLLFKKLSLRAFLALTLGHFNCQNLTNIVAKILGIISLLLTYIVIAGRNETLNCLRTEVLILHYL